MVYNIYCFCENKIIGPPISSKLTFGIYSVCMVAFLTVQCYL